MNREQELRTKLFCACSVGDYKIKMVDEVVFRVSPRKKETMYVSIYFSGLLSSRKVHQVSCQREMKAFRINSNMGSHVADHACKITLIFIQIGI